MFDKCLQDRVIAGFIEDLLYSSEQLGMVSVSFVGRVQMCVADSPDCEHCCPDVPHNVGIEVDAVGVGVEGTE